MGILGREVAVSRQPLWNSGIPGIMGILGRDVAVSQHPLWNSGIPGIMGIMGRDVAVSQHPLWNSGKSCSQHPLRNSGIPEILGKDVISLGPLELRNSGNYGNSGKRCHITGPSGIPEFREFWEEMLYYWALWNSGIPENFEILGREEKNQMKYKLPMLIKIIAQ